MDNKSGNEILNDDRLEKVSGGFSFEHSCPKCHSHQIDLYYGPFGPYYICGVCGSESKPEELE